MVPAQQNGQTPSDQFFVDGAVDQAVPGDDFRQMAVATLRGPDRVERAVEVSFVLHIIDNAGQRLDDARHAERVWPHVRAPDASTHVCRCADDAR